MIKSKIPAQLLLINTALPNPVSNKQTIQPWKWELFTHTVRRSATSSSHRDVKFLTKQESSLSLSSSQFKSITFPLCSNMTTHWKPLATQAWDLETKSKGSSSNFSFLWASKQWAFAPNVPLPPTAQHLNGYCLLGVLARWSTLTPTPSLALCVNYLLQWSSLFQDWPKTFRAWLTASAKAVAFPWVICARCAPNSKTLPILLEGLFRNRYSPNTCASLKKNGCLFPQWWKSASEHCVREAHNAQPLTDTPPPLLFLFLCCNETFL